MAKTHKVAVHGVMKINGQMAYFGDEVERSDFDRGDQYDFDNRVSGGYIKSNADFDAMIEESELTPAEKKKLANERQIKADEDLKKQTKKVEEAKKVHDDLLVAYLAQFNVEAPDDASDADLKKAIKDKTAIPVE